MYSAFCDAALQWSKIVEGVERDLGVQGLTHGPADDLAGVNIEDGDEVEPALAGRDVGQVGEPDLVGSRRLEVAGQPAGRDGIAVTAVGRPGPSREAAPTRRAARPI